MDSLLVSIIVTIYNKKKHLQKCLDSICSQTYKYLEIILVDDGSNDGSEEICDEYALRDKRIRVVHKSNGGVALAKQKGLEIITGDYFIYVDADDWIELDMIEKLCNKVVTSEPEMLFFDYIKSFNGEERYEKEDVSLCTSEDIIRNILSRKINGSCSNKLIKSSCLKYDGIKFPNGLNYGEDLFFVCSILKNDIKISYINEAFYHYNLETNGMSLSKIVSSDMIKCRFLLIDLLIINNIFDSEDDLFTLKFETLQCLFMLRKFNVLNNTYQEIHNKVINNKYKLNLGNRLTWGLSMALKGYPHLSYFIYKLYCYTFTLTHNRFINKLIN